MQCVADRDECSPARFSIFAPFLAAQFLPHGDRQSDRQHDDHEYRHRHPEYLFAVHTIELLQLE
jgi:hypothetical protein